MKRYFDRRIVVISDELDIKEITRDILEHGDRMTAIIGNSIVDVRFNCDWHSRNGYIIPTYECFVPVEIFNRVRSRNRPFYQKRFDSLFNISAAIRYLEDYFTVIQLREEL